MTKNLNKTLLITHIIHSLDYTRTSLLDTNRHLSHANECLRSWRHASLKHASATRPCTAQELTGCAILKIEDTLRQLANLLLHLHNLKQCNRKDPDNAKKSTPI